MELVIGRKKHRVLIDDEDWELVRHYRIHVNGGYVYMHKEVNSQRTCYAMHRFLMGAKPGEIVDHIDGNRTNNMRGNLRIVTQRENAMNRGMHRNNKTGVNGVFWNKWTRRYTARVSFDNQKYYLGQFNTIADAKAAVEEKAQSLRGEYHRGFNAEEFEMREAVENLEKRIRQLELFEMGNDI